jgi:hypothetical protein
MWMRPVTLWAALIGLSLVAAVPAAAQELSASHLAAARELVVAGGTGGSIDAIFPTLFEDIRRQSVTRPELSKDLNDVLKSLEAELETQRQQAMNIAARGYAKWLSEAEIRDALAFFTSASGKKYVTVLPDLTEDVVQSLTSWSQVASEYVMTRVRVEMTKRGHQMQ